MWIGWLILAAVLAVIEMTTLTFYCLLLAVSALIGMALALLGLPLLVQLFSYVAAAFLLYLFVLPLLRGLHRTGSELAVNPSQKLVGHTAVVTAEIRPEAPGQVIVNGELWTAVAEYPLAAGEQVVISEVGVTKLTVKKG